MKLPRRSFLHLAAGAVALPAALHVARAEAYPIRPVHLIVGAAPGLAPDIFARLMGQWLSEQFNQQFVIDNRPGAGTNIGTEEVVRAAPDGYALLLVNLSNAVNASLYPNLNFNFMHDIAPVAGVVRGPYVMVVNPSLSAKTVPEFIAYAKANPGKINYASGGNGTPPHVFGELFKMMTGVDLVHVPYRSSQVPDLLGGQIQVAFMSTAASIEYIRTGKVRALAVTTARRSDILPDIPAMAEFVSGYEGSTWYGIGVPKGTPPDIVDKLSMASNAALVDPLMKSRLANLGAEPMPMTPAEFGRLIADETEKWGKVVKFAAIKLD